MAGEVQPAAELSKKQPKPSTLVSYAQLYERSAAEPGMTQLQRELYQEQARKSYQQALKGDSKYKPALLGLAALYDGMNDHSRALATLRQATQAHPQDAQVWFELGMSHARAKEWDLALEGMARATELDPENRPYANQFGYCLARAGRFDESFATFKRLHGDATAHYNVARMLHHVQQDDRCKDHLRQALQADPQYAQAKQMLDELEGSRSQGVAELAPPVVRALEMAPTR